MKFSFYKCEELEAIFYWRFVIRILGNVCAGATVEIPFYLFVPDTGNSLC